MVIDEADEMLQSDWETELKQIMSGGGKFYSLIASDRC
jgi:ATP-dependent RNA helicase DDX3X